MAKCVIEGCGREIHPERLQVNPRIKTCSPECAHELLKHHRRESAKRAMKRKRQAAKKNGKKAPKRRRKRGDR